MATKLPYVLPFEDGSVVAAILLKAQGLPETEQIATKTELQQATAYLATLDNATMAPQSATVKRTTDNLQTQINNIVRAPESGGDVGAEVYQARVDADGVSHATLKARCDSDFNQLRGDLNIVGVHSSHFNMDAATTHSSSSDKIQMVVNSGDSVIISVFTDTTLSGSGRTYDVFGYPVNSSTGTKIGTGTTNGSRIKITVDTAYSSLGVYVRALGVESKVTFLVENENSIVTRCAVLEKKEFDKLTPLILGHNQPYKVAFSAENKTMTIPKDTIAFVVSDLGVRSWLSITPDEASVISLDIGTSAISVYFDAASSEFSAKAYNSALSDEFMKNNILIANIRFSADGMILPSIACEYKIVEDVPLPFIYGYGVMLPSGTGAYPEIDTIEKTVFIPSDTLILDNRLPNKYLSLQATTVSFADIATGALVVYYDITNESVSIAGYSSSAFRTDDEIVLFTFRKSKKTVCSTIPIFVDSKLFGIIDTSKEVNSSFVHGINHRGYNTIAPENTIPAYKLSKQYGFDTVETDVEWTSDGIPVLLHDSTIDRTSNGEGNVSDFTYNELLTFDFGSWKSAAYAGTRIPTFDEFMKLCRNLGMRAYVEIKGDQTQERINLLIEIVKKYHMIDNVTWISSSRTSLARILNTQANARIGITQSTATNVLIDDAISMKTNSNSVFLDISSITDELIELCIENDIPVEMWTVNSSAAMLSANSYVSGFTSDSINAKEVFSDVSNN